MGRGIDGRDPWREGLRMGFGLVARRRGEKKGSAGKEKYGRSLSGEIDWLPRCKKIGLRLETREDVSHSSSQRKILYGAVGAGNTMV
jgi:hypothetical protein